jgi:radical SAM enzyme (TIGR01210 family)
MAMITVYPSDGPGRDRFVELRRNGRPAFDPFRYQGVAFEQERSADGRIASVAVLLLTGRECPWRCVMCDLWRGTTHDDTPLGAIPSQIEAARREWLRHGNVNHAKLYNASSFFDPRAVPEDDYGAIASSLKGLTRAIVETHPSLVGNRVDRLLGALSAQAGPDGPVRLEVAMGLETAHPVALERLNKRMTVGDFRIAAAALRQRDVAVRAIVLIGAPFIPQAEQMSWLLRSVDEALSAGSEVVSLVPVRPGNGSLEALIAEEEFMVPTLETIERTFDQALAYAKDGRIFLDIWDLGRFASCGLCFDARRMRLHTMNLQQRILPHVACSHCGKEQ